MTPTLFCLPKGAMALAEHVPDSEKEAFEAQLAKQLGRLIPNPEGQS